MNTPAGLEQGFTLGARPGARRVGEWLRLALQLVGEAEARLEPGGQALSWTPAGGATLRYDHLKAWEPIPPPWSASAAAR